MTYQAAKMITKATASTATSTSDVAFALAALSAHSSSGFLTLVYNKFVVIPPAVPASD